MSENPFAVNQMFDGLSRLVRDVTADGNIYSPGLEGVVCAESALTTADGLLYRGFEVERLASAATYPEVAWLMLNGELPNQDQYADFRSTMIEGVIDPAVSEWVDSIPMSVSMSDVVRTTVSMLGHFDAQPDNITLNAMTMRIGRLLNQLPQIVAARFRELRGLEPVEVDPGLSYVTNLYRMLTGSIPTLLQERALEAWMIISCDEQFDTSTFSARVIGSGTSDLYAILSSAMATFTGRRHSPRHTAILRKLLLSRNVGTAEDRLRAVLQKARKLDGFVPAMTDEPDSRVELLTEFCREIAAQKNRTEVESIASRIEEVMYNEFDKTPMPLWPALRLHLYLDIDKSLIKPLMMLARLPSWAAHAAEQSGLPEPMSPVARYIGPSGLEYRPLALRG